MKLISNRKIDGSILTSSFSIAFVALFGLLLAMPAHAQSSNTRYGNHSLNNITTGDYNSAFGESSLLLDQTGSRNTGIGSFALQNNQSGNSNTAVGAAALGLNLGSYNTGVGDSALLQIENGNYNTASGYQALYSLANGTSNLSPSYNTATGAQALYTNMGDYNTASGGRALYTNSTGTANTANGYSALRYNNTGSNLTGAGAFALFHNTSGVSNTACGYGALNNNTSGSSNIAVGDRAGYNLTTGSNNIDVGNTGAAGESGKIRIGTKGTHNGTFIAGISGKTVANGAGVIVNANGQLGTIQSSARYKDDIKPMDKASEAILALKPATFRYKEELDPDKIPQFGLIAEEVEKIDPNLVVRDEDGKVMTVRYEAINAMLLNEFLKEHRRVQELERQIQALTVTVQKVGKQSQPGSPSVQGAPEDF